MTCIRPVNLGQVKIWGI